MNKKIYVIFGILLIIGVYFMGFQFGKISEENNKKYSPPKTDSRSYVLLEATPEDSNNELISTKILAAFDKDDILVDSRFVWEFATEEIAKENYEKWKEVGNSNLSIDSNIVYFNQDSESSESSKTTKAEYIEQYKSSGKITLY